MCVDMIFMRVPDVGEGSSSIKWELKKEEIRVFGIVEFFPKGACVVNKMLINV